MDINVASCDFSSSVDRKHGVQRNRAGELEFRHHTIRIAQESVTDRVVNIGAVRSDDLPLVIDRGWRGGLCAWHIELDDSGLLRECHSGPS